MNKKTVVFALAVFAVVGVILFALTLWFSPSQPDPSSNRPISHTDQPFSAKANIQLGDTRIVADINKTAPDALTLQIEEPASLKGLMCYYDGTDISLRYKNMQVKLTDDTLLSRVAAAAIVSAVNATSDDTGISIQNQDGKTILQGNFEQGAFTLEIDPKSGSLMKLSVPNLELECEFSDFAFLETSSDSSSEQHAS